MKILSSAFALSIIMASGLAIGAHADEKKPAVIAVSATGSAAVAPDLAILDLSVQKEAKTAREALMANNQAMAEVLEALKASGVEERDLQTSNFNIQPRYFYPKSSGNQPPKPPQITGYIVSNSLTVRIRDLSKVGEVLDTSVTLGVNNGGNIRFSTDNPEPTIETARKNAMAKAIAKARTLAEAAGVQLGRVLEIGEQNHGRPVVRSMARMEKAMAADSAVPIASGENSYSVTVNVRWEIDQ